MRPAAGYGLTSNSCAIIRVYYSTLDGCAMAYDGFFNWKHWGKYLDAGADETLADFHETGNQFDHRHSSLSLLRGARDARSGSILLESGHVGMGVQTSMSNVAAPDIATASAPFGRMWRHLSLARKFHRFAAAAADLLVLAALNAARVLDVLSSTPARPDSRSPCQNTHLHALASRIGEIFGLAVNAGDAGRHRVPDAVVILGRYREGLQAYEGRAPGRTSGPGGSC